ncbi:MAG: LysR family transcriptional regulator [Opitutaceae bacterium]|nr:LysR family transcriptional regulator [Opitutaceae bacterium]
MKVLLEEGSVARAARRLRLSPSAMSRALARLRSAMGDPLLVRAGRGLVPTPRAAELRDRVGHLVQESESIFRPVGKLEVQRLTRTFTLRTSEGFVENFGPRLVARIGVEAQGVQLRFIQKPDKDSALLREGLVDLETGVVEQATSPELRVQQLFRDRYIGVLKQRHPLIRGGITAERYAACRHIDVSRDPNKDPINDALAVLGLKRRVVVSLIGGFSTAIALARNSDLIATVPERHTGNLRTGMHSFRLPVVVPEFVVSMLWHPRLDADPAHRWLREIVRDACAGR